jgi:hypothetical protein
MYESFAFCVKHIISAVCEHSCHNVSIPHLLLDSLHALTRATLESSSAKCADIACALISQPCGKNALVRFYICAN